MSDPKLKIDDGIRDVELTPTNLRQIPKLGEIVDSNNFGDASFPRFVLRRDVHRILKCARPYGYIQAYYLAGSRPKKSGLLPCSIMSDGRLVIGCTRFTPAQTEEIRAWARKRGTSSEKHK